MPSDENNENNEIIQKGGEGMGTGAQIGIGVGIAAIIIILFVLVYLYNLDYVKELQEACVEMIRKELKMQMRLCLTYDLKISKTGEHHKHEFSKIFILNKLKNNYFFDKLTGDWNQKVSFKEIFEDTIIQEMLENKDINIKKEDIVKYIIFDIFFCSINDVILDEILNDFKENGLKDAKPKKDEKKAKAAIENAKALEDGETDETIIGESVTVESIKQQFENMDKNNDGKITSEEFKTWTKEQGEAGTGEAGPAGPAGEAGTGEAGPAGEAGTGEAGPGEAGPQVSKKKKKMQKLNKKIKLRILQRIGLRIKSLNIKKYINKTIATSENERDKPMTEISTPVPIKDKPTIGKILEILDDELDIFLGGEKKRPKTPTDEEKEQQKKYDDMKNTLKELASKEAIKEVHKKEMFNEEKKRKGVMYKIAIKGAKLAAGVLLNSWWKGKEGELSFNQNIIKAIFEVKNGELPEDIPKATYKDMEEKAKIKVTKKQKNSIKKAFDIQDKICKQLENVSQKVDKLEIEKIMASFTDDGTGADGAGEECEKDCQKNMYNNIFSSCDASLNGVDEKSDDKKTLIDICKEIVYLKPLNIGWGSSLKFSKKKNLYKTHATILDSKKIVCKEIFEALIEDVLTPLKEAIAEKFEEQTETCKAQLKAEVQEDENPETVKKGGARGGGLIGQGSFGCVFRPHIKCNNSKKKKNYVTKLIFEKNLYRIERELRITKKIMSIPNYQDFFAPIEEMCDANMSKFNETEKKNCKLLTKKNQKKYIKKIANIRFIEGDDILKTLKSNNQKDNFIYFLTMYEQILHSLQLLVNKKIVHYDIKPNNLIYNKKKNKTFIFDFGLSFDIENIINYKKTFYIEPHPAWTLWPVEVHYLGFIISKERKMFYYEINEFADEYTQKHWVFKKSNNLVTSVFLKSYKDKITKILNSYNKKDLNEIVHYIINYSWKTWDNYALNIMFFRFFSVINIIGFSNNNFYQEIFKLFNDNISPIPSERNSIKDTKKKFQNIKKLLTPQIFNQVSKNLNDYKIIIEKTLKDDYKKTISMGNKIRNLS